MALLVGLASFAQREGHHEQRREAFKELTPEQVATLKTKKMALALDLDEQQQKQLMEVNLEDAAYIKSKRAKRKAKKESDEMAKPTVDERFALENERLDRKLAQQQKLKQILTDEQYAQWKKISHRKHTRSKKKMPHRSRRG